MYSGEGLLLVDVAGGKVGTVRPMQGGGRSRHWHNRSMSR